MPPIVSIVGLSASGKTTLIEKLIKELKSRGYRVATIKHATKETNFDTPGKDSWRHIKAGSEATLVSAPDNTVLITPESGQSLGQLARTVGEDYDIILTEGFKTEDAPKIEVHRKLAGPPLTSLKKLFAIVSDEPLETKTRQFSPEDVKGLADLLEKGFILPQRERLSLYANNEPVPLSRFPRQIVANILLALAASLKGVKRIKSLDIFYRQP
jgi:molybdopterin-guanine dinucleotide biosynthesis protein B